MEKAESAVSRFFDEYVNNTNSGNFDALAAQFSDIFIVAGPEGSQPVPSQYFSAALRKRKETFVQSGHQSSDLISMAERKLNDRYVLADTQWRMRFHSRPGHPDEIVVKSTFILDTGGSEAKVVLYMPHQDPLALRNSASENVGE